MHKYKTDTQKYGVYNILEAWKIWCTKLTITALYLLQAKEWAIFIHTFILPRQFVSAHERV